MTSLEPAWVRPVRPLLLGSVLVVAASVGSRYLAYRLQVADPGSEPIAAMRWLDVNSERNVPTAWSVLLLLASAVTAAHLARRAQALRLGWVLVAVVATLLALDEGLSVHERLGDAGRAVSGSLLHFAWVVPGLAIAGVVGALMLLALHRQPLVLRRRLVLAGVVYLSGAVVLETVAGLVLRSIGDSEAYLAATAAEEGLEMAGACLLLAALLSARPYVGARAAAVPVQVVAEREPPGRQAVEL